MVEGFRVACWAGLRLEFRGKRIVRGIRMHDLGANAVGLEGLDAV